MTTNAQRLDDTESRALGVLSSNRYLVLATVDANGPWSAALAFTPFTPASFYFMSQMNSRHGRALRSSAAVAGTIFDSTASPDTVESIQFSGTGALVAKTPDVVSMVLERSARMSGGSAPDGPAVEAVVEDTALGLYRVDIEAAFVLDQVAWTDQQVDARQAVAIHAVFARWESSLG